MEDQRDLELEARVLSPLISEDPDFQISNFNYMSHIPFSLSTFGLLNSSQNTKFFSSEKGNLKNIRIIERNVIYLIGIKEC